MALRRRVRLRRRRRQRAQVAVAGVARLRHGAGRVVAVGTGVEAARSSQTPSQRAHRRQGALFERTR